MLENCKIVAKKKWHFINLTCNLEKLISFLVNEESGELLSENELTSTPRSSLFSIAVQDNI